MSTPSGSSESAKRLHWEDRLAVIVETMREISRQSDPQVISRIYSQRMRALLPTDRFVALSRRDLAAPWFRVTRCSLWPDEINPWKERDRLPLLRGGLFAELLYADTPRILDRLAVDPEDPAHPYVAGMGSLVAIPHFDQGVALNMVLLMRASPEGFAQEDLPELVWMNNLYGRATNNLVLAEQVREAFEEVDQELRSVADLQRSLLPDPLPKIPTMGVAAHYQTSRRAGGDYYDFFPLPGGLWGILIADVSGHGTPAAVLMAVTHTIAHTYPGPASPPGELLSHLNDVLAAKYTADTGAFVTAFYAVYDPALRRLTYSSAGHPPPRLKRCADGTLAFLDGAQCLPLGVLPGEHFRAARHDLVPGDQIVFYTDGVADAENDAGEPFGITRLDAVLANCAIGASDLLHEVLDAHARFCAATPPADDCTLLVAKIS